MNEAKEENDTNTEGADNTDSSQSTGSKILWSMYIPGMDEYHACKDIDEAEKEVLEMREYVLKQKGADLIDAMKIVAAKWPFGEKSHATALRNKADDY